VQRKRVEGKEQMKRSRGKGALKEQKKWNRGR
jgi:hypothetical protein